MLTGTKKFTENEKKQLRNKILYYAQIGLFKRVLKIEKKNKIYFLKYYDKQYEEEIGSWEANHDSAISDITETITVNTHNGKDITICVGMTRTFEMPDNKYEVFRTNINDLCSLYKEHSNDVYVLNLVAAALNAKEWFVNRYRK